jgi:hypothetical protein
MKILAEASHHVIVQMEHEDEIHGISKDIVIIISKTKYPNWNHGIEKYQNTGMICLGRPNSHKGLIAKKRTFSLAEVLIKLLNDLEE